MSKRTIYRYVEKFRRLGNVDISAIRRPYSCIAMDPHEELVIMEALLQRTMTLVRKVADSALFQQIEMTR